MRHPRWTGLLAVLFSLPAAAQELVVNGDFEAGLANWTVWAAPPGAFWNGVWLHQNDCDIWTPPSACPFAGTTSHSQEKGSGAGNAHGGITQQIAVQAGRQYRVSGQWSGGVTGNAGGNATWWEVVIYDGAVDDAVIDAGLRPQDVLIDKIERAGLATNEVFQFDWRPFDGIFTAGSNLVTLAFKQGSFFTFDAAAYHDAVSMQLLAQPEVTFVKTASLQVDVDGDARIDRGDTLRYTLLFTNPADGDALDITGLVIDDALAAGLQLVVGSVTTSTGTVLTGNVGGDTQVSVDAGTVIDAGSVTISFDAVVDPTLPAATLQLGNQASASADNIATTPSDDPGTVAAADATVIAVQGVQAITAFAAVPASGVVGGTATLSASGGASGNPVVFASLTPTLCSVTGSSVSLLAVGTCQVSANQAGNAQYNAAPQATLGIVITPAPQAITGFALSPSVAVLGGSATLSASGGASGNPIVFASTTPTVCSVNGSVVTFLLPGICIVSADQAGNANYLAAPQVTLSVAVGVADTRPIPTLGAGMLALAALLLSLGGALALRMRS